MAINFSKSRFARLYESFYFGGDQVGSIFIYLSHCGYDLYFSIFRLQSRHTKEETRARRTKTGIGEEKGRTSKSM